MSKLGNRLPLKWFIFSWRIVHRIRARFALFFIAVGLKIITLKRGDEPRKVLLYNSRRAALARCGVHILPALLSLALTLINLPGLYIGNQLQGPQDQDNLKLGVLQVCAKLQELLIIASLATLVFHVIRAELIQGNGIPLGLLASGFSFSQPSFFWSSDFWAALSYNGASIHRKAGLLALILTCGIIAVLAGPVTAVLMIPREIDWPVGGAGLWLNGTKDEMWPTTINSRSLDGYNCSSSSSQLDDPNCPSAGYRLIYNYLRSWVSLPVNSLLTCDLQDRHVRKSVQSRIQYARGTQDTWSVTAHAPTAIIASAASALYIDALSLFNRLRPNVPATSWLLSFPSEMSFTIKTQLPAVRASCLLSKSVRFNSTVDLESLDFAILPDHSMVKEDSTRTWSIKQPISPATMTEIRRKIANLNSSRDFPILATPMKLDISNSPSTIGIIFYEPLRGSNNTIVSWKAVGCSVDARWAAGSVNLQANVLDSRYDYRTDQGLGPVDIGLSTEEWGWASFTPPSDGSWRPITVEPSWFDLLAPPITSRVFDNENPEENFTTLERLAMLVSDPLQFWNRKIMMEHMIAMHMVDGISRVASHRTSNYSAMLEPWVSSGMDYGLGRRLLRFGTQLPSVPLPENSSSDQYTPLAMHATIHGFVMAAYEWLDYFCVGVLLLHVLLALSHTAWVLWWQQTSDAWESIPELLVLAQNSSVPQDGTLENTCVGIRRWKTAAHVAWIERRNLRPGDSQEQLQLRFRGSAEAGVSGLRPTPGEEYGRQK